ncbi:hypothetical protein Tco_1458851 [Tanacetum coccineum]
MQNYTRYDAQSFYDAMIFNMDSLGKYMLELILHQQRTPQLLKQKKLMQTQEDHSNPIPALNVDSLKVDLVVIQNTCSEKEDSNSENASSKLVKECSLNSETKDVHAIKYKMSKSKERCMAYFDLFIHTSSFFQTRSLKRHSHRTWIKRAFMSLFGQDVDTFTRTMLLNVDQLQKQLDKDEFQEDGSMTAFWVTHALFNTLESRFNTSEIHYSNTWVMLKKSMLKDTSSRPYERRDRLKVQDDSSRSGNDTDADDADIRPIYDEEPMAEVQLTAECNIFAIGQQHTEQPEIIIEGRVDHTDDGSKPKPRSTNNSIRSLHVSKSSCVTIMVVPKADHSKSSSSFSDSKNFVCSTCHKCVFNANHDACITKLLKEVNSRAKTQSNKTTNSNKPVDQKSHTQKPGRQIFIGHRFSPNTTFAVYEKTSPRSDLRWKPTGRIFESVGLRWIPTGKLFDSCTSKVDSEPPHGSNVDIPNIHACKQTLDVRAGTSINVQKEQNLDLSAVSTEVHQAAETVTTSKEMVLIFGPLFDEYFNGENQVVLKSSAVTTTDASNKRQQQPDSTSSTSTLASTVTANGNFDL